MSYNITRSDYSSWCKDAIKNCLPAQTLVKGAKQAANILGKYKINRVLAAGSAGAIWMGQVYTCLLAAGLLPCINGKVPTEDHFREIFIATCLGLAVANAPIALNQYQRLLNSTAQLGGRPEDKTQFMDNFLKKYSCIADYSTFIQVLMMMLNGVCVFETFSIKYNSKADVPSCLIEAWRGNMPEKIGLSLAGAFAGLALGGPQMEKNMNKESKREYYGPFLTALAYSLYIMLIGILPIIINFIREGKKAYSWDQTSFFMIYALIMPWFRTLFYETLNLKPGQTAFFKKSRLAIFISLVFSAILPFIAGFSTYHSMYAMLEQFGVSDETAQLSLSVFMGICDGVVQTERAVGILAQLVKELSDHVAITEARVDPHTVVVEPRGVSEKVDSPKVNLYPHEVKAAYSGNADPYPSETSPLIPGGSSRS